MSLQKYKLNGLFYASKEFVTITAHSCFASSFSRPLSAAGQATCSLHGILASSNIIATRSFNAIFISTISHHSRPCIFSEHDSLCLQKRLCQEIRRTHIFPLLFLVISSLTHQFTHYIVCRTGFFPTHRTVLTTNLHICLLQSTFLFCFIIFSIYLPNLPNSVISTTTFLQTAPLIQ